MFHTNIMTQMSCNFREQSKIVRTGVSPAYGHIKSALVKCSNDGGPGPRHNMKEEPGTSTLIMKGEHGQEVPCDPGQVTSILGSTSPPLPPPPTRAARTERPPTPFQRAHPSPSLSTLEAGLRENTLRPRVQDQRPWDGQEEDEKTIGSFSAAF